jgi:hypothetical protein
MIDPKNEIPLDDSDDLDKEDQMSQQDIHSNGLEEERVPSGPNDPPGTDFLEESYRAADSSFTLEPNDAPEKKDDKKK